MAPRLSRRRAWQHSSIIEGENRFGLSGRLTARERGPVVGTTDQVKPQDGERSRKAQRVPPDLAPADPVQMETAWV